MQVEQVIHLQPLIYHPKEKGKKSGCNICQMGCLSNWCLFNLLGSLSPMRRGSFDDGSAAANAVNAEAVCFALNDVASSSKNTSKRSGWTSSEDEADAMDQDEGVYLQPFSNSIFICYAILLKDVNSVCSDGQVQSAYCFTLKDDTLDYCTGFSNCYML